MWPDGDAVGILNYQWDSQVQRQCRHHHHADSQDQFCVPRFRWVTAPSSAELARLTQALALHIGRYLERRSLLERFGTYDCYLFGNEARSLPREALGPPGSQAFALHGCGPIESLNLAAVVNMCAYELNR